MLFGHKQQSWTHFGHHLDTKWCLVTFMDTLWRLLGVLCPKCVYPHIVLQCPLPLPSLSGKEIADIYIESHHQRKVVKSSQKGRLSLCGEGGQAEWQSHPESGTDEHDMPKPNSPLLPSPSEIIPHSRRSVGRSTSKWVLSLSPPICIAAAILIALITFVVQQSCE